MLTPTLPLVLRQQEAIESLCDHYLIRNVFSWCIPFVSWIRRPNVLSKVQFKTCLEQLGKGAYYTRKYEAAGSRSSGSLKIKEETINDIRVIDS